MIFWIWIISYTNLMIWMMTISAKKVFISLLNSNRLFPLPAFVRAIFIQKSDGSLELSYKVKKCRPHFPTPLPLTLEGLGGSFFLIFPHNSLMNILQKIFKDHFEEMIYIQHPRDSVIENVEKIINCGRSFFLVAPCIPALPAEISNMFLSAVIPGFVLPAATCIPSTELLLCPLRSSMSSIDTVSLPLHENYVLFFLMTVLF